MFDNLQNLLGQVIIGLIGGIVGGGLISALIDLLRYKRETEKYADEKKKFEAKIIFAASGINHWHPKDYIDKDEKLRVFEAELPGKIKDWNFIIKIEMENLTDHDLLAYDIILDIPEPIKKILSETNSKLLKNFPRQTITKYDLIEKNVINDSGFPFVIPARSSTGIVIIGEYLFDYPELVDEIPKNAKLVITTDNPKVISIDFTDQNINNLPETAISENGNLLWSPYMEKFGIKGLPF